MQKRKGIAGILIALVMIAGCTKGEKTSTKEDVLESKSVSVHTENTKCPEQTKKPVNKSAAVTNSSIYNKTYVYHDLDFNSKAITFRVLKLDTKKTYQASIDEERMNLLDVAESYFLDLAKKEGITKEGYLLGELEYVYELSDHLLYMPVYFIYNDGERKGEEKLINLIIQEQENDFVLLGQTDRALLNEEQYPKVRKAEKQVSAEDNGFTFDKESYRNFFKEGKQITKKEIVKTFIEQTEMRLVEELADEEMDDTIRIGVIDLVQNERNAYFCLIETVFYDTNNTIKRAKRYEVVDSSGELTYFTFHDLGEFNRIVMIAPEEYILTSGNELLAKAVIEEGM